MHRTRQHIQAGSESFARMAQGLEDYYRVCRTEVLQREAYLQARDFLGDLVEKQLYLPHRQILINVLMAHQQTGDYREEVRSLMRRFMAIMSRSGRVYLGLGIRMDSTDVEQRGLYGVLTESFLPALANAGYEVRIHCRGKGRRYNAETEEDVADTIMHILMHMVFDRAGTQMEVRLLLKEDSIEVMLGDNDYRLCNTDLWGPDMNQLPGCMVQAIRLARDYGGYSDMPLVYTKGLCIHLVLPVQAIMQ